MNKPMMMLVAVAVAVVGSGCGASAETKVVDATSLRSMPSIAIAERVETIMPGEYEVSISEKAEVAAKPTIAPMTLSHEIASKRGALMYGSVGGLGVSE